MGVDKIIIHGAREHNLKNVDVEIPRDKLVVVTGLSGSGKSSLAFDTLYAEGQRRYVESLSSYARQFLGQMDKPDVDSIEGLSPAISIDQKTTSKNPRSTVGTVTEINDYLRLLWARVGTPICPNDGSEITSQSPEQMVDRILKFPERTKVIILAPVVRGKKGQHKKMLEKIKHEGFIRLMIDGKAHEVDDEIELDKNKKHDISVVVDRIVVKDGIRTRLFDSFEAALRLSDGYATAEIVGQETIQFSESFACPYCGFTIGELEPRLFSFNAPFGACPECDGLGAKLEVDMDLVVPDQTKTLHEGAIAPWNPISSQYYPNLLEQACQAFGVDMDTPFKDLSKKAKDLILYGSGDKEFHFHHENDFGGVRDVDTVFEGVINNVERRYRETNSDFTRDVMRKYMTSLTCSTCHGYRLNERALAVKIDGKNIGEVSEMSIGDALPFFKGLTFSEQKEQIAKPILKEICDRLSFLVNVGLAYLTLSRSARTLSGGEAQRIRLATQIGSNLSGVLYILDEPSIGLHQRDNRRLISSLKALRDTGNTVVVVEHDEEMMESADYIIDMGPKAGRLGGEVVFQGTPEEMLKQDTLTSRYLNRTCSIQIPGQRRKGNGHSLWLRGARGNNLKGVDVEFPLGQLICITGVSGSGKSTLINDTLQPILSQHFYRSLRDPLPYDKVEGLEFVDKVVSVDQSPIGRLPRSNPATYTGVFNDIRALFVSLPEAKIRGYKPGRFSFNVKGGRCEACGGNGYKTIEMNFLPDVYVPCEVCHGKRYNRETLEVRFKGKSIADVLDMTINRAVEFFENQPVILNKIKVLQDVGLGYIKLGQPSTTLSGGESQRIKLATELSKRDTGQTIYILDEPTTGLHFEDIRVLLGVLNRLVDKGNTVMVIEHNLDVIKSADFLIDMGPDGGRGGGELLFEGTPEDLVRYGKGYTAAYLKEVLYGKAKD